MNDAEFTKLVGEKMEEAFDLGHKKGRQERDKLQAKVDLAIHTLEILAFFREEVLMNNPTTLGQTNIAMETLKKLKEV